jgi:hypothetical protein
VLCSAQVQGRPASITCPELAAIARSETRRCEILGTRFVIAHKSISSLCHGKTWNHHSTLHFSSVSSV